MASFHAALHRRLWRYPQRRQSQLVVSLSLLMGSFYHVRNEIMDTRSTLYVVHRGAMFVLIFYQSIDSHDYCPSPHFYIHNSWFDVTLGTLSQHIVQIAVVSCAYWNLPKYPPEGRLSSLSTTGSVRIRGHVCLSQLSQNAVHYISALI